MIMDVLKFLASLVGDLMKRVLRDDPLIRFSVEYRRRGWDFELGFGEYAIAFGV